MAINFLNTVAVDENVLFVDATNNRVGVGTSTPGSVLDVQGSQGQLFSVTDDLSGDIFAVSDISGIPILNVNSSGAITFNGYIPDNNKLKFGNSGDLEIYHDGSNSYIVDAGTGDLLNYYSNDWKLIQYGSSEVSIWARTNEYVKLFYNGNEKLATTNTGVSVTGDITFGDSHFLGDDGNNNLLLQSSSGEAVIINGNTNVRLQDGGNTKLTTTSTGVTVTGTAAATTFSGDLNGTINTATTATTKPNATNDTTVATTAFVQNLIGTIPAGLVFQGTWNAATNTPTLSSGSGTTGHFYIVSTDGSTDLDGITDWKVGDWAVFVEQGATDAWEKVDNSSVLDGTGTGQKVTMWSGSGTSNTLTNAPITVSGDDATFAGTVYIPSKLEHTGDSDTFLNFSDDTITLSAGGSSTTFSGSGNATFAGDVAVSKDSPILTLKNTTNEHTDGGAESKIVFKDHADNSLGKIEVSHNGNNDNALGNMYLQTSNGSTVVTALELNSSQNATFAGDLTVNGSHLTLANGTTHAASTDYLYIGGSGLASADAAIYIGNGGGNTEDGYGYRIYYSGSGSGNDNKLILKSENYTNDEVDMLTFTADGNATFAGTVNIVGTNSTNQESVLLRGITSDGSDLLGSIRTANTGGYNQEMRFYTSNANGTTDEDLTLTLKPDQSATFAGDVAVQKTGDVYLTLESTDASTAEEVAIKYSNQPTGSNYWWQGLNQSANWSLGYGTSFSGSNTRLLVNTSGNVGIGNTSPVNGKLVVDSDTNTLLNTVRINHTRSDSDIGSQALFLDVNLSGADNTTGDRTHSGISIDLDSSADGDASNEHRIKGVNSDVKFSGFSDVAQGVYGYVESNYTGGKTAQMIGVIGSAVHDSSSTDGGVSNMYGVYGSSQPQDLGDVDNAFGGYFIVELSNSRGNADFGVSKGVEGHINIDKAAALNYGAMMAVSGIIDNNEGTVPNFGNQYLFKGDYQGTKGDNAYGIYTEGDKHYFDGNIGIGSTSPTSRLTVQENGITAKIATVTIGDTTAGASLTLRGGSPTIYFDRTGTDPENKILMDSAGLEFKTGTLDAEGDVDFKITAGGDLQLSKGAKISNQENTDIDSAAAEVVAQVAHATYTAAFFDFVVKKGTNVRSGTVYACHNGDSTPLVEFTETSTNDLGDTSDVTLSVDISGANMRLLATVTSDDWSVKSLIRAI